MPTVIRSKRRLLLGQAIPALAIAAIAGWMMQSWGVLQSSVLGKLSVSTGLPVIAFVVWAVAVAVIGTVILDHWNFRIQILDDHLLVCDRLGTTKVYYDNIERAEKVPYGAGIVLKNPGKWLESFQGKQSALEKLSRNSGFLKGIYGCDVCIKAVRLDIGVDSFLSLLNDRTANRLSGTQSSE